MHNLVNLLILVCLAKSQLHLRNFFERQRDNAMKVVNKSKNQLLENARDLSHQLEDDMKAEKKYLKDNLKQIKENMIQKLEDDTDEARQIVKQQVKGIKDELDDNFKQAKQAGEKVFDKMYSELENESKKICDEDDQELIKDLLGLIQKKKDREAKKLQQRHDQMINIIDSSLDNNLKSGQDFIKSQLDQLDETVEQQFKDNDDMIDQMIDQKFKQAQDYLNDQKNIVNKQKVQFNNKNPYQDEDWQYFQEQHLNSNQLEQMKKKVMSFMYNPTDMKFMETKSLECDNKHYQKTGDLKCLINMVYEASYVDKHVHEYQVLFETQDGNLDIHYVSHIN